VEREVEFRGGGALEGRLPVVGARLVHGVAEVGVQQFPVGQHQVLVDAEERRSVLAVAHEIGLQQDVGGEPLGSHAQPELLLVHRIAPVVEGLADVHRKAPAAQELAGSQGIVVGQGHGLTLVLGEFHSQERRVGAGAVALP